VKKEKRCRRAANVDDVQFGGFVLSPPIFLIRYAFPQRISKHVHRAVAKKKRGISWASDERAASVRAADALT